MKVYYDNEADLKNLKSKKIVVLGYGSQGHAHALNLKESGFNVRVGLRTNSKKWNEAKEAGLEVFDVKTACKDMDVIMMLVPDQNQKEIYDECVLPYLKENDTLVFAHGFNIHFKNIVPPANINVMMVAPKSPGHLVRRTYQQGNGVPSLIAVYQDYSGNTKDLALAWAKGIGSTKAGVIETSFKNETETDLFGEQAVLCGGIAELIKAGFETLTEAGYPSELAYFECLHEMKLIVDLFYEGGLSRMNYSVSDTAEYGGYVVGPKLISSDVKLKMKEVLANVQNGTFANNFISEYMDGLPNLLKMRKEMQEHPIEKVGSDLRKRMSWLNKN